MIGVADVKTREQVERIFESAGGEVRNALGIVTKRQIDFEAESSRDQAEERAVDFEALFVFKIEFEGRQVVSHEHRGTPHEQSEDLRRIFENWKIETTSLRAVESVREQRLRGVLGLFLTRAGSGERAQGRTDIG